MFELDALNGGGGISNIQSFYEVRSRVLEKLLRILEHDFEARVLLMFELDALNSGGGF